MLMTPTRRTQEIVPPMPNHATQEEWRLVASLDNKYAVSNLGRVRRAVPGSSTYAGRIISTNGRMAGYPCVNPNWRAVYVHRLVAEAFLGAAPSPTHQINHIDGDKINNRAGNLEWVTPEDNSQHAVRVGLTKTKLTLEQARTIKYSTAPSGQLAAIFAVSEQTVRNIRAGKTWRHVE